MVVGYTPTSSWGNEKWPPMLGSWDGDLEIGFNKLTMGNLLALTNIIVLHYECWELYNIMLMILLGIYCVTLFCYIYVHQTIVYSKNQQTWKKTRQMQTKWKKQKANQQNPKKIQKQNKRWKKWKRKGKWKRKKMGKQWTCPLFPIFFLFDIPVFPHLFCFRFFQFWSFDFPCVFLFCIFFKFKNH